MVQKLSSSNLPTILTIEVFIPRQVTPPYLCPCVLKRIPINCCRLEVVSNLKPLPLSRVCKVEWKLIPRQVNNLVKVLSNRVFYACCAAPLWWISVPLAAYELCRCSALDNWVVQKWSNASYVLVNYVFWIYISAVSCLSWQLIDVAIVDKVVWLQLKR